MKTMDFYGLAPAAQDRLRWSMRGQFDPKPLLFQPGARSNKAALLLSGLAVGLLAGLWLYGFGQLEAAAARQPSFAMVAYVGLIAAAAWGVLEPLARGAKRRRLPFVAGIYLFGARLLDAREARLRVFPIEELSEVRSEGKNNVVLRFGRERFVFRVAAEHLERAVALARGAREHAVRGLGRASRYELDPFEPPALAIPLPPQEAAMLPPLRWPRMIPIVAAAIGLTGVGLFVLRDHLSDARMFEAARAEDSVETYRRYLERGEAHREEVSRRLLPRAALRGAVADGSVAAIDAFAAEHPDHDIAAELAEARQKAVLAAFERARAEGSLTSLASFAESHPDHHLNAPFRAAMKTIYRQALEEVRAKMPAEAKAQRAAIERLFGWAEKVGPRALEGKLEGPMALVRIRPIASKSMDRADEVVRQNPYYGGDRSLPSKYFDRAHLEPLEREAATALARSFSAAFPSEVLRFSVAALDPGELPPIEAPTLLVSYRVEPSGQNYASKKPRGIYVGVVLFVTVELLFPDGGERVTAKHVFAQRIPARIIESSTSPSEPLLYETMMREGFAELHKRILAEWFREAT